MLRQLFGKSASSPELTHKRDKVSIVVEHRRCYQRTCHLATLSFSVTFNIITFSALKKVFSCFMQEINVESVLEHLSYIKPAVINLEKEVHVTVHLFFSS